jgi:hypothetical protein
VLASTDLQFNLTDVSVAPAVNIARKSDVLFVLIILATESHPKRARIFREAQKGKAAA